MKIYFLVLGVLTLYSDLVGYPDVKFEVFMAMKVCVVFWVLMLCSDVLPYLWLVECGICCLLCLPMRLFLLRSKEFNKEKTFSFTVLLF
jgi:hypothetical protein